MRLQLPDSCARGMRLVPMTAHDLDDVLPVEAACHPFPWTRGNFLDSLQAGHSGLCLRDADGALAAYCLLMPVFDEFHLLNITVAPACQRRGLGRALLDVIAECTRGRLFGSVLLEVRPSNQRAIDVYRRYGFIEIGRRKGYYPAAEGREDALVMRLPVAPLAQENAAGGAQATRDPAEAAKIAKTGTAS